MNDLELRLYGIKVDEIEMISKTSNIAEELESYMDEIDTMIASSSSRFEEDVRWQAPIAGAWRCRSDGNSMKESYSALRKHLTVDRGNTETGKAGSKSKVTSSKDHNHVDDPRGPLWAQSQDYYLALQGNLTGWN
ncbi:hypothetical protein CEP52_015036 [Fusarium oligoseptatum]|uniref:Uncharacterized protein n=1 Tax=Fusarium oligoseptatum TaxID=2604345 RepID=A0A428SGQ6_9HYPO|nr:hypothetical protein CEP52_015036 [Fusarium oligoseptatum]